MTFPLPFAGEQVFVAPVAFDELPVFLYGVAAAVVKPKAHLTVLIDQLHARLLPAAYVAVAEFKRRSGDSVLTKAPQLRGAMAASNDNLSIVIFLPPSFVHRTSNTA
jgi:hypothetical protein